MTHAGRVSSTRARRALNHYALDGASEPTPLGDGLINETLLVESVAARHVLQRVNAIFDKSIHRNIRAVTERLSEVGLLTPLLVPTRDGHEYVELDDGSVWRLISYVPGHCFHAVQSPAQARSAAALVARFHAALADLDHQFVGIRNGVHDTAAHLARLESALTEHRAHHLYEHAATLGAQLLVAATELPSLDGEPLQPCHGDLKISNILFAGAKLPAAEQAVCLIDLDTLAPMPLAHELGDAWRSWCNPSREDSGDARFDMAVFEASWEGYRSATATPLEAPRLHALLHSVEWISLELAVRFTADALAECYFGWDPGRFASRGDHNLARARGQWALHQACLATRSQRAAILEAGRP
jgi:Ser/Thr protein kinase RdoA (MazF antagonist)